MSEIGVVHLVRKSNGVDALRSFIESYQRNNSGVEHDLIVIFKGFERQIIPAEYLEVLNSVRYLHLFMPDRGFDLGAYFLASTSVEHKYLCFLNSYSYILCDAWLEKLFFALLNENVGAVGATASYQSHYSNYLYSLENPPPEYRPSKYLWRRLAGRYVRARHRIYLERNYDLYPNYHLRTNAFMISRQLMLSLKHGRFRSKNDLWKFESGKDGFTRQIYGMGLNILVVGRDGKTYEKEEWPHSMTFSTSSQENLLVADNQTQLYALADEAGRADLYERTWCRR